MNTEKLRAEKLAEIEEKDRQLAIDEIMALKERHLKIKPPPIYNFEHDGKLVKAVFVTAGVEEKPPNFYRIELLAPKETVVNGKCMITDRHGKQQSATATTIEGPVENRIILETLAVKP